MGSRGTPLPVAPVDVITTSSAACGFPSQADE